jgi:tRNA(fMet)-specific endonuclease VapC
VEMNRLMLDTTAYSHFLKGHKDAVKIIREAGEIILNPVVIGELLAGFIAGNIEKKNRAILGEFMSSSRVGTVVLDDDTAERYGMIYAYLRERGTPVPTNDIWIAASAMQHGLALVTSDSHFARIPHVIKIIIEP